jgi:hypothetical protein
MSNTNVDIAAVNAIMMATSTAALTARMATPAMLLPSDAKNPLANKTVPNTASYTILQTTTATTTATAVDAASTNVTNDTSNEMHVDTATAASPTNELFTYSHEEVQQLLEDARLDTKKASSKDTEWGGKQGEKKEKKTVTTRYMKREVGSGQKATEKGMMQRGSWNRRGENKHARRDSSKGTSSGYSRGRTTNDGNG